MAGKDRHADTSIAGVRGFDGRGNGRAKRLAGGPFRFAVDHRDACNVGGVARRIALDNAGAWVGDLPANFQWFGLGQTWAQWLIVTIALAVLVSFSWVLGNVGVGRALYAVGSDTEAARLAGIVPQRVVFGAFTLVGALVGLAALLNAVRFSSVPSNAGLGLELKAVAAVVVGGTEITGGSGRLAGTLLGVVLLGTIGTALTFVDRRG